MKLNQIKDIVDAGCKMNRHNLISFPLHLKILEYIVRIP